MRKVAWTLRAVGLDTMAELGGDVPSFDELLDSSQPKDTQVIILEEYSAPAAEHEAAGRKRKRPDNEHGSSITLEAHWVVLFSLSPYFRTKLERWSRDEPVDKRKRRQRQGANQSDEQQQQQQQQQQQPQPQPYQYSLQLLVPPGQLELGRRLITAMYSSSPDLSDLEAPQLMALVALAECYGVGKVVTAAAAQLHKLSVDTMPLETAAAVFELPEACLGLPAFKSVQRTAASKLQQQLGDLEMVWGDKDKQEALLGLPFGALLQLLKDDRTRVAGEDTAVYTAAAWLAAHEGASGQARQLRGLLRLPLCTVTYLSDPKVRGHLICWGLSQDEVCDLCALAGLPDGPGSSWLQERYQHRPAWHLPSRPESAVTQLVVRWQLSLSELQAMYTNPTAAPGCEGKATVHTLPEVYRWQGRAWRVGACVALAATARFGLFLDCSEEQACCDVQLCVVTNEGHRTFQQRFFGKYMPGIAAYEVCEVNTWAQLRAWLEERHLVHAGGLLRFTCTVTSVL